MDKKAIMNKYGFLVIMVISVVIFAFYLGVKDIKKYKQQKREAQKIEQEEEGKKVVQNSTGEIQIVDDTTDAAGEIVPQPPLQREFVTVDRSYLDGALFIGDSRTQTISVYGDWDNTVFYVKQGVSIWKVLDEKIVKGKGKKKITVRKALDRNKFDKIYIMLGINELGTGTAETFGAQFGEVVQTIREKQPDAIIFIQSIMHVTKKKDKSDKYIKNKEIDKRNKKLKALTNGYDIIWLDENEVFDDKDGKSLNPKFTSDGVHLTPSCLPRWEQFFLEHGIVK